MKKLWKVLIMVTIIATMVAGCKAVSNETEKTEKTMDKNETEKTEETMDKNETEKIEETMETKVKYFFDEEYLIDLNKDDKEDTIKCYKEENKIKVAINGEVYELTDTDYEMVNKEYFIIDIDENDYAKEIIFKEAYPPFEEMLSFYRYGKDYLQNFGTTTITIQDVQDKMIFDGQGNIKIATDSNIMQKGYYYKNFIISETGYLEQLISEDYIHYINEINSKVNKKIKAYEEKNVESKNFEIMPDENITIYGEKDNWLNIKWNDKELWINGESLEHFYDNPEELFQFEGIKFWS